MYAGGHNATESFGVQDLMAKTEQRFLDLYANISLRRILPSVQGLSWRVASIQRVAQTIDGQDDCSLVLVSGNRVRGPQLPANGACHGRSRSKHNGSAAQRAAASMADDAEILSRMTSRPMPRVAPSS